MPVQLAASFVLTNPVGTLLALVARLRTGPRVFCSSLGPSGSVQDTVTRVEVENRDSLLVLVLIRKKQDAYTAYFVDWIYGEFSGNGEL